MNMKHIDYLMQQALSENVFPGAVLLVSKDNAILFYHAYGYSNLITQSVTDRNTIYDLASLTKPLATTLAIMALIQKGKLYLNQPIGSILPPFCHTEKETITIRHLLCHNSGLPDYRPYYSKLSTLPPEKRKTALNGYLVEEPLLNPIGKKVVYSDLGFMILRWLVETVSNQPLDHLASQEIYHPLGIWDLFFAGSKSSTDRQRIAATERCLWRNLVLQGQVHDENAWVMGGVEGHAGLFGTAIEINKLLWSLMNVYYGGPSVLFFEKELLKVFFKKQVDSDRALGFDMPSGPNASCGHYFSDHSVGHLGFTGTSFWMDLDQSIVVILLTNRIHLSRDNIKIREFRPLLHNVIMETVTMKKKHR